MPYMAAYPPQRSPRIPTPVQGSNLELKLSYHYCKTILFTISVLLWKRKLSSLKAPQNCLYENYHAKLPRNFRRHLPSAASRARSAASDQSLGQLFANARARSQEQDLGIVRNHCYFCTTPVPKLAQSELKALLT